MENLPRQKPRVVIVGAGFGGLEAAKKLACKDVHVTVIDRTNHHLFQPLLYQVATAALSPADIAAPIRGILSKCENMEVILAEVRSVEVDPRLLAAFPEDLSASALKQLVDLGVEVRTGARATDLTETGVQVGDEFIPCRMKIWAAGNNASFVGKTLGAPIDRVGRVMVNDDLTIPGHPDVHV